MFVSLVAIVSATSLCCPDRGPARHQKEKEREVLIQEILLLIVDSNICLLQNTNIDDNKSPEEIYKRANKLKIQFDDIIEEIEEINKEYSLVIDITNEIQKEIERNKNN